MICRDVFQSEASQKEKVGGEVLTVTERRVRLKEKP